MAKQTASSTPAPRLCPTCGTRVGPAATKCLVCGADLTTGTQPITPPAAGAAPGKSATARSSGFGLPQISLPLPAALAAVGLFVVLGLVLIFGAIGWPTSGRGTPTSIPTSTAAATFTPRPTGTETPASTATPLPPVAYTVKPGDTLGGIAVQFNVSIQSIVDLNGLAPESILSVGQQLQVPQPTPTPTPQPTPTVEAVQQTVVARPTHIVLPGETLGGIAKGYNVDFNALLEVNNIVDPSKLIVGQTLIIPIDRPVPTVGPTPTETPPPPYPAPHLLSPADGASFTVDDSAVPLQWATVDILRPNEVYFVTVVDVTCNCARELRVTTNSNRLNIPVDMRPLEAMPHVFKWTVVTARQTGADARGQPIYEPAGATSDSRTFTWVGPGAPPTPSPTP